MKMATKLTSLFLASSLMMTSCETPKKSYHVEFTKGTDDILPQGAKDSIAYGIDETRRIKKAIPEYPLEQRADLARLQVETAQSFIYSKGVNAVKTVEISNKGDTIDVYQIVPLKSAKLLQ